ncbi:MAG: LamG domain-containing protein [Spirosomataceae bacterium]
MDYRKNDAELDCGLVASYPFNNNSEDESTNDFNGINNGATITNDRFIMPTNYSFDGNDFINVNPWNNLTTNSKRTISLWFKTSSNSNSSLISWGRNQTNELFEIGFGNAGNGIGVNINSEIFYIPSNSVKNNKWHHLLVAYDTNLLKIFMNGVRIDERKISISTYSLSNLRIGASITGNNYFTGQIDEIKLYNRDFTDHEVATLYTNEAPPTQPIDLETGLIAYYPFSNEAQDASGNNNHGVVNGATPITHGNLNRAYSFDGIDDWISTPMIQNNLQAYSISAWVKPNFNENKQYVVLQNRGVELGGGKSITLHYDFQNKKWGFACDGDYIYIGTQSTLTDLNSWVHIVGTWQANGATNFNANQFKLYFNGILQIGTLQNIGSASIPNIPSGNVKIGKHDAWNSYFKGSIDDLRLFNRALSEAEVFQLYNLEKP